jgi:hypothetical protein
MPLTCEHWMATIDPAGARLWRCCRAPGARWRLEEKAAWEPVAEQEPVSAAPGPGASGTENGNGSNRFAQHAAAWLMQAAADRSATDIELFAPPALLDELRASFRADWGTRVHGHEGCLSHLRPRELADHPLVTLALSLAARRSAD